MGYKLLTSQLKWCLVNTMATMTETIRGKLAQGLQTSRLDIVNESALHAGHAGDDGSGESHFRVLIVSSSFEGVSRIERQRMVYAMLKDEIAHRIHAISIKALTDEEYSRM